MAAIAIETVPVIWDDERDNAFFRITASLFSCEFTYGAGVLLASYDNDFDTAATPTASESTSLTAITSTAPSTSAGPAISR